MKIASRNDILEILNMPEDIFYAQLIPAVEEARSAEMGKTLIVTAMIGYSNICKNKCLYCGIRAPNTALRRFRTSPEDVLRLCLDAADNGYGRVFLISGEDPKYGFDDLLNIVGSLKARGMHVSLACGEYEKEQYEELLSAGTDEYVLKFEMSHPESFNRLNPSTNFEKRMKAIETIRSLGMKLASGNIIDWPGQTVEELADDILLMQELEVSWAPVIPYMPAANTPLAVGNNRGNLLTLYKEIAILRLMMPAVNITAQQPGIDPKKGLSDTDGNLAAITAGANVLFFDLLPEPLAQNFRVIDERNIRGMSHIYEIAEISGYAIDTGKELLSC